MLNNSKKLGCVVALDLSDVEFIEVEAEPFQLKALVNGEFSTKPERKAEQIETLNKVKDFITKHPDYVYYNGYEGYKTILFSKKPKELETKGATTFHRGGSIMLKQGDKTIFVGLDLD